MKCSFCNKDYKRATALRKHLLICEIINNKSKSKKMEMIPSTRDMFELIKKLLIDNESLKHKMSLLEKKVYKKKQKIKILDWLNDNIEIKIHFDDWIKSIEVDREDFDVMLNETLMDCIVNIFEKNMEQIDKAPMQCFIQKKNCLFVFNGKWKLYTYKDFSSVVYKLQRKLLHHFDNWLKEMGDDIYNNRKNDIYLTNNGKILGNGNMKKVSDKIYHKIYNKSKINVRDIMEFEIIF